MNNEPKVKYRDLWFLHRFLKGSKLWLTIAIVGILISSLITAPIPYIIGSYIIDKVILMNKSYDELYKIILLVLLIYLINYLISIGYEYSLVLVKQNIVNKIRLAMIRNVMEVPVSYINEKEKGYVLGRIAESGNIGALFSSNVIKTFYGIPDFLFSLIFMISLSIKLSMVSLVIIPIYFVISKYSSQMISKSTTNVYETTANFDGEIYETLNGVEHIQLLNGQDIQMRKLSDKLKKLIKSSLKQGLQFILFVQNIVLTNNIITVSVLLFSGILILRNSLTIGVYTSFSLYMAKLLSNTQSLGSLDITLKPICVSMRRIREILDLNDGSTKSSNETKMDAAIDSIEFQNVSFKYNENSDLIFDHLNIKIVHGDKVLINGANGAGKTTLIKLLLGLYRPTDGIITINNKDYTSIDSKSIREKIGIVSQDIFLFKGTVLENILYGQKDKRREDVVHLIRKYKLTEYLNKFQRGLDTQIIQTGTSISGGQAQFIAFMRAIISNRDIIVLDEATSNLHVDVRNIIYEILENNNLCNILIMVSHQKNGLDFINREIDLENCNHRQHSLSDYVS